MVYYRILCNIDFNLMHSTALKKKKSGSIGRQEGSSKSRYFLKYETLKIKEARMSFITDIKSNLSFSFGTYFVCSQFKYCIISLSR